MNTPKYNMLFQGRMSKLYLSMMMGVALLLATSSLHAQNQPDSLAEAGKIEIEQQELQEEMQSLFGGGQRLTDTLANDSLSLFGVNTFNRRIVKRELIKDASEKQGIVVLDVCLDQEGQVLSAEYTPKGSTTLDEYLIQLSIENVQQWGFSTSDTEKECGTITFHFRLR